jgi:NAD(P)-dependent dehydrogenase (short-subunit alcohol dehydrogenase family)
MSFGKTSTAAEVIAGIDLIGKTAVITGATGGIGLETARAFASAGARVLLGNRSADKSAAAVDDLLASVPGARAEAGSLDLTSLASVRAFADWVLARTDRIDLLVNNAGVMATPFERTSDGFELQFGTNHVAHFLLTARLMSALLDAAPSRVVNLTSSGHRIGNIDLDDVNYDSHEYAPWPAYGASKTANILFTGELDRRFADRGVHSYCVHPGTVATDLFRYLSDTDRAWLDKQLNAAGEGYKTPQEGAATTVWAATTSELADAPGAYTEDCRISKAAGYARDAEAAARLWTISEELVGERFPT